METLKEDMEVLKANFPDLKRAIEAPTKGDNENKSKGNGESKYSLLSKVPEYLYQKFCHIYRIDFELFGYDCPDIITDVLK